jgi:NAD(P)-dependent dehydrogenase (short-subunit alcohol dehydrogenase family)
MGQVNVVRFGREHIAEGGSIVLTSGLLGQEPIFGSAAISMINAGLEGFSRAAELELGSTLEVRVVSPIFVVETMRVMGMDTTGGIAAAALARVYRAALTDDRRRVVFDCREFMGASA